VTGWLLDTNVISELRRPRPKPSGTTISDGLTECLLTRVDKTQALHSR
jgi:predicted nucleic acid-binding protein